MTFRSTELLPWRRLKKDQDMSVARSTGNIALTPKSTGHFRIPFAQSIIKKADSLPSLAQNGSVGSRSRQKSIGISPLTVESSGGPDDSYA